jgi:hypothetical protein
MAAAHMAILVVSYDRRSGSGLRTFVVQVWESSLPADACLDPSLRRDDVVFAMPDRLTFSVTPTKVGVQTRVGM